MIACVCSGIACLPILALYAGIGFCCYCGRYIVSAFKAK